MASITGFVAEAVTSAAKSVNNSFEGTIKALHDDMWLFFIDPMGGAWASKQAVDYFQKKFKPAVDGVITEINKLYEEVVTKMNEGGKKWAAQTGDALVFTPVQFTYKLVKTTVDNIKENINGVRGIDRTTAVTLLNELQKIQTRALGELNNTKHAISNSGFLGGDQQKQLNSRIEEVKTKITNLIQDLMISIKKAITTTVDEHGDTAGQVAQALAGVGAGAAGAAAAVFEAARGIARDAAAQDAYESGQASFGDTRAGQAAMDAWKEEN